MSRSAHALLAAAALAAALPLAAGGGMAGGYRPFRNVHVHVCGFHFYNGEPGRQVAVHHYCSRFSPDLMQCVLFDSDRPEARLVGIEYIISARLFQTLPPEEKRFWHSHRYEVKSGQLAAPGLAAKEERAVMAELLGTYGKTWHTWQFDRDLELPLGPPQLMMGFTADGQVDPSLVTLRDRTEGISTSDRKSRRKDLPDPWVDPQADAWMHGDTPQVTVRQVPPGR